VPDVEGGISAARDRRGVLARERIPAHLGLSEASSAGLARPNRGLAPALRPAGIPAGRKCRQTSITGPLPPPGDLGGLGGLRRWNETRALPVSTFKAEEMMLMISAPRKA